MTRDQVSKRIVEIGIVPVVRASSPEMAVAAVAAIQKGGIPIAEITMTVPGAIDVIRTVCCEFGSEVLVGAGTVLSADEAKQCIDAGAEFVVSPALDLATIEAVHAAGKLMCPGALTPTEVVTAWKTGADFVKVFPCGNVGGAKYIKSLKAPFPQMRFIPTGGVSLTTAAEFLEAGADALGVGADLVDTKALAAGESAKVTEAARQYADIVKQFRGRK
ncbi:MAG TPA: bifunctional 4-hydroxy-2-oxoglutarate aldolase/2-dehydro-3-deoxy-phosphogluconate aldolase [Terriglobales bacterium]|nr:bifunctional 4-hydroxy-2-oxoglutarate aldolase/2-dehydro-3-deoxy-phosphogluconate aldolase [Terriglobales bacterium]